MNYNVVCERPYKDRVAQPIYFYPFLSPLSHKITPDALLGQKERLSKPPQMPHPALIYVHIPYCQSLCLFCGFYRQRAPEDPEVLVRYVRHVQEEMRFYAQSPYVQGLDIQAIYFGGGTPTILPPELISDLLTTLWDCFPISPGTELSYEGEVRTLCDPKRLAVLRDMKCTRVSFGVQSFDPRVRRLSGLAAEEADIMKCLDQVHKAGYQVNLDLMYGLPGQTPDIWRDDLSRAVSLGATNIDIYDTVLYPHTQLFRLRNKLKHKLPDQSMRLSMLAYGQNFLAEQGYVNETIEDMVRPGFAYRMKRLVYGGGNGRAQMIGLGASSIGFLAGAAYRNLIPGHYESWPKNESPPLGLILPVEPEDMLKRALVFFPKVLSLDRNALDKDLLASYEPTIASLSRRGLLEERDNTLILTPLGKLWTDNMGLDFLSSHEQQKIWKIGY